MADDPQHDDEEKRLWDAIEDDMRAIREQLEGMLHESRLGIPATLDDVDFIQKVHTSLQEARVFLQLLAETSPDNPNPPRLDDGGVPILPPHPDAV